MKKHMRFFLLTLLLLAFGLSLNAQTANQKKILVAVLDFDARAGIGAGEAASLSDIFSSQLAQSGKFILVERNGIKKILNEQGFQQSEACSSVECIAEVGKILKVEKIFSGTIGKIGKLFTINIQLINVSTAQIEISKNRQHEGDIEDLATTVIPEIAVEMTKSITGESVEVEETTTSSSKFHRHEIEIGIGGGPESKGQIFDRVDFAPRLSQEVHIRPKSVFHLAYRFSFSPYFSLGLRMNNLTQKIDNLPIIQRINQTIGSPLNQFQTITIRINTLSFEGRVNFLRGRIEPYGTLSLGLAFGNIGGDGSKVFLAQQDFDGPALGFGLGSRFYFTSRFGATVDLRVLGISAGYKNDTPTEYRFSSQKFDGSYSTASFILFYQF